MPRVMRRRSPASGEPGVAPASLGLRRSPWHDRLAGGGCISASITLARLRKSTEHHVCGIHVGWYASPVGWNVRASYTMTRCPGIGSFISASWLTATREAFRNVTPSESHADASMLSRFVNAHPDVEANGSYRTSIEGLLTTATRVPSFGSTDTPLRLSSTSLSTCLPQ